MAMQCGIGSQRSMGGIAKTVSALKILGDWGILVIMVGWVGGISQNTPAKETPIKGTFVKNEGWWGLGRSWGPLRMGGGGERWPPDTHSAGGCRLVRIYPVCTDFCLAPHFLQHYKRRKHPRNWQHLVI